MSDSSNMKKLFFEDLAAALKVWTKTSTEALTATDADLIWADKPESFEKVRSALIAGGVSQSDVQQVIDETLRGILVTALTVIDGGSALAKHGRLYLVDRTGESLGDGLHDEFVSHLFETGHLV